MAKIERRSGEAGAKPKVNQELLATHERLTASPVSDLDRLKNPDITPHYYVETFRKARIAWEKLQAERALKAAEEKAKREAEAKAKNNGGEQVEAAVVSTGTPAEAGARGTPSGRTTERRARPAPRMIDVSLPDTLSSPPTQPKEDAPELSEPRTPLYRRVLEWRRRRNEERFVPRRRTLQREEPEEMRVWRESTRKQQATTGSSQAKESPLSPEEINAKALEDLREDLARKAANRAKDPTELL